MKPTTEAKAILEELARIKERCANVLTSFNRRSEKVIVEAIIVPELELRNVKMQLFLADAVECAKDPRLISDQKPSIVLVWTAPTILLHGR
jgi:hypothetical protein